MNTYTVEIDDESTGIEYMPAKGKLNAMAMALREARDPKNADKLVYVSFSKIDGTRGYINADGSADITGHPFPSGKCSI